MTTLDFDLLAIVGVNLYKQCENAEVDFVGELDPIMSAFTITASNAGIIVIEDSKNIDTVIKTWVEQMVGENRRIIIIDAVGGTLTDTENVVHLSRGEKHNLGKIIMKAGMSPAKALRAAPVTIGDMAPKPVVEPVSLTEAKPVVEPEPVIAPEPVTEPVSLTEAKPVIALASKPVEKPKPVIEIEPEPETVEKPESETVDVVEVEKPVVEPEPVIEPESVEQPEPVIEAKPVIAPKPKPLPATMSNRIETEADRPAIDFPPLKETDSNLSFNFGDSSTRKGSLLFTIAAKGGVLKTSTSIALAQRAGLAGLRTMLIDGNRGQGDIKRILRLKGSKSIYDYAQGSDLKDAVYYSDEMVEMRGSILEKPAFTFLPAPPDGLTDPNIVSSRIYKKAISEARMLADIVIVDTQTADDTDTSDLFESVYLPFLSHDAWALLLSEVSVQSLNNITSRFENFRLSPTRTLFALTQVADKEKPLLDNLSRQLSIMGTPVGVIEYSELARAGQRAGALLETQEEYDEVLANTLTYITGNPIFEKKEASPAGRRFLPRFFKKN